MSTMKLKNHSFNMAVISLYKLANSNSATFPMLRKVGYSNSEENFITVEKCRALIKQGITTIRAYLDFDDCDTMDVLLPYIKHTPEGVPDVREVRGAVLGRGLYRALPDYSMNKLQVWAFEEAPDEFKELSQWEGEKWLSFIPSKTKAIVDNVLASLKSEFVTYHSVHGGIVVIGY